MGKDMINELRFFLKSSIRKQVDLSLSDQSRGIPMPPKEKETTEYDNLIPLIKPDGFDDMTKISVLEAIKSRETRRKYKSQDPLTLKELSYLLYSTQGVRRKHNDIVYRTVPSAGNRHPFDTYVISLNIEGLEKGIYRYLPLSHSLVFHKKVDELEEKIDVACNNQIFVSKGVAVFVWVGVPYRTEWRYMNFSHKSILLDAGHICQNLYLASESIGYGTCAIGSYDQELMDNLLGIDGEDEFTIYLAPVGK